MKQIQVTKNDAGQRLDKMLRKYLNLAPSSFIYKMLRKKNIKLNGKKASGNEIISFNDLVEIYLSDDTFRKFSNIRLPGPENTDTPAKKTGLETTAPLKSSQILYEDEHICLINKPQGILSQKADPKDVSVNEQFLSYLLVSGQITPLELQTFHPSVCNRLDRNTSGIVIAGKSLKGLQEMGRLLQTRDIHKYYWCIVDGILANPQHIEGFLKKDDHTNTVHIYPEEREDARLIVTEYTPLFHGESSTLLEVLLVTGRTHQIRAHLASIGHPILGDAKYGSKMANEHLYAQHKIRNQMLHARRIEFPHMAGALSAVSGRIVTAPLPRGFADYVKEVMGCPPGTPEA